jgi:hypothetical protein
MNTVLQETGVKCEGISADCEEIIAECKATVSDTSLRSNSLY